MLIDDGEKRERLVQHSVCICWMQQLFFGRKFVFLTPYSQSHTLVVKKLSWRPKVYSDRSECPDRSIHHFVVQLASAGADHAVKIFNINTLAM